MLQRKGSSGSVFEDDDVAEDDVAAVDDDAVDIAVDVVNADDDGVVDVCLNRLSLLRIDVVVATPNCW